MIDERDRELNTLFAKADQPLEGEAFISETMMAAKRSPYRRIAKVLPAVLALLAVPVLVLAAPLQQLVVLATGALAIPLLPIGDPFFAAALLPVNNVAALCAIAFLLLRAAHRRLFR